MVLMKKIPKTSVILRFDYIAKTGRLENVDYVTKNLNKVNQCK